MSQSYSTLVFLSALIALLAPCPSLCFANEEALSFTEEAAAHYAQPCDNRRRRLITTARQIMF